MSCCFKALDKIRIQVFGVEQGVIRTIEIFPMFVLQSARVLEFMIEPRSGIGRRDTELNGVNIEVAREIESAFDTLAGIAGKTECHGHVRLNAETFRHVDDVVDALD